MYIFQLFIYSIILCDFIAKMSRMSFVLLVSNERYWICIHWYFTPIINSGSHNKKIKCWQICSMLHHFPSILANFKNSISIKCISWLCWAPQIWYNLHILLYLFSRKNIFHLFIFFRLYSGLMEQQHSLSVFSFPCLLYLIDWFGFLWCFQCQRTRKLYVFLFPRTVFDYAYTTSLPGQIPGFLHSSQWILLPCIFLMFWACCTRFKYDWLSYHLVCICYDVLSLSCFNIVCFYRIFLDHH